MKEHSPAETTISILGCGWLGFPLAKQLIFRNFHVNGSTTSVKKFPLLKKEMIRPSFIQLGNPAGKIPDSFLRAKSLVIAMPASSIAGHAAEIRQAIENSPVEQVIYCSSTGVYPDLNREVSEDDAIHQRSPHSGIDLLLLEQELKGTRPLTIIRFGGLYGPDRHPGRFLAGKRELTNPDAPVNLIHLDDCVNIIRQVILQRVNDQTLNACADEHPSRRIFYKRAALSLGLEPPTFSLSTENNFKIVRNERLKVLLNYSFLHPDPLADL